MFLVIIYLTNKKMFCNGLRIMLHRTMLPRWPQSSSRGTSESFATMKCLRIVFINIAYVVDVLPELIVSPSWYHCYQLDPSGKTGNLTDKMLIPC